jgi:hypothetical protein
MNSEKLYNLLKDFTQDSIKELGLKAVDETEKTFYDPENGKSTFEVVEDKIYSSIDGTYVKSARLDSPEELYKLFLSRHLIEPAEHYNYLKGRGLDI